MCLLLLRLLSFFPLIPGEDELSFAYDGRGKKVSGGKEEAFGELLSEGDIVGCYAVSDTFLIGFFKILTPVLLSCHTKTYFGHSSGHFPFSDPNRVCVDSPSPQTGLSNSLSIRTVGSWVKPFPWRPLCCCVVLWFLTSSVKAVRYEYSWTPKLLPGTRVLRGSRRWRPSLPGRGCAPRCLRLVKHSVR